MGGSDEIEIFGEIWALGACFRFRENFAFQPRETPRPRASRSCTTITRGERVPTGSSDAGGVDLVSAWGACIRASQISVDELCRRYCGGRRDCGGRSAHHANQVVHPCKSRQAPTSAALSAHTHHLAAMRARLSFYLMKLLTFELRLEIRYTTKFLQNFLEIWAKKNEIMK